MVPKIRPKPSPTLPGKPPIEPGTTEVKASYHSTQFVNCVPLSARMKLARHPCSMGGDYGFKCAVWAFNGASHKGFALVGSYNEKQKKKPNPRPN